jgi:hypothetical protein
MMGRGQGPLSSFCEHRTGLRLVARKAGNFLTIEGHMQRLMEELIMTVTSYIMRYVACRMYTTRSSVACRLQDLLYIFFTSKSLQCSAMFSFLY